MKSESQNIVSEIKAANNELASKISEGLASEFKEVRKEIAENSSGIKVIESELDTVKTRDSCPGIDKHERHCLARRGKFISKPMMWGNVLKIAAMLAATAGAITTALIAAG